MANSPTRQLHELGQSLWLDNLSRELISDGRMAEWIEKLHITGLTSNPTIFERAFTQDGLYDEPIQRLSRVGLPEDQIYIEIILSDLKQAYLMFKPAFDASGRSDGLMSLEVPPTLAFSRAATVGEAKSLHVKIGLPNLLIKIPATQQGIEAYEECIFEGIPVNVTLIFALAQYRAVIAAYQRAIERRLEANRLTPVRSVASVFVSRWDVAVQDRVPEALRNRLGIAVARKIYQAYRAWRDSAEWQKLQAAGAMPQRLLWASTGTKDPQASDVLYVESLIAPDTINTLPEATLLAFADHGRVGAPMPADGGDADAVLGEFAAAGVDLEALGAQLLREGVEAFEKSWHSLMKVIAGKRAKLPE